MAVTHLKGIDPVLFDDVVDHARNVLWFLDVIKLETEPDVDQDWCCSDRCAEGDVVGEASAVPLVVSSTAADVIDEHAHLDEGIIT